MATRTRTLLAVLTLTAAAAGAQPAEGSLAERVRVTLAPASEAAQPRLLVGTLTRIDSGELGLQLDDGRTATAAVAAVRRFERSRGPASRWRHGLEGAAIGAAAALTATLSWWALSDDPEKELGLGLGLFLYTPAAAGLGLSIGLALPPAERWETTEPPRASRAAALRGRAPRGLQLSVRF